jgi:CBS domain containing-hemolysin-like protein
MMAEALLTWMVIGLCLALSFVLSGMEAGVFALSRLRVRRLMRSGRSSARVLYGFLENPENFLWTILVGNTFVNFIILGWLVPVLHMRLGGKRALFALMFAVVVFVFYTLFDLLPKMLFRAYPNRLCMFFAKPFSFAHLALRPLVALLERSSAFLLRWTGGRTSSASRFFGTERNYATSCRSLRRHSLRRRER